MTPYEAVKAIIGELDNAFHFDKLLVIEALQVLGVSADELMTVFMDRNLEDGY